MIPTIQSRRDEGSSSSSRSFIFIKPSRHDDENMAMKRAITISMRTVNTASDIGFCIMSESELKMALAIEENIVSFSI
jgi:hypothetical protein